MRMSWSVSQAVGLYETMRLNMGVVVARLEEIARKRKRTPKQHLALLGKSVPSFAAHLAEAVGGICRTRGRGPTVTSPVGTLSHRKGRFLGALEPWA